MRIRTRCRVTTGWGRSWRERLTRTEITDYQDLGYRVQLLEPLAQYGKPGSGQSRPCPKRAASRKLSPPAIRAWGKLTETIAKTLLFRSAEPVAPLTAGARYVNYRKQRGYATRITPRQIRRLNHKAHRADARRTPTLMMTGRDQGTWTIWRDPDE